MDAMGVLFMDPGLSSFQNSGLCSLLVCIFAAAAQVLDPYSKTAQTAPVETVNIYTLDPQVCSRELFHDRQLFQSFILHGINLCLHDSLVSNLTPRNIEDEFCCQALCFPLEQRERDRGWSLHLTQLEAPVFRPLGQVSHCLLYSVWLHVTPHS